jgi:hypothetical protein
MPSIQLSLSLYNVWVVGVDNVGVLITGSTEKDLAGYSRTEAGGRSTPAFIFHHLEIRDQRKCLASLKPMEEMVRREEIHNGYPRQSWSLVPRQLYRSVPPSEQVRKHIYTRTGAD